MRRYLIVANQTLGGEQLTAKLTECMNAGPCRFYLVVPVTQTEAPINGSAAGWTAAWSRAPTRSPRPWRRAPEAGAGPAAASREEADEVIVSTLRCRWSRPGCRS
jgi:hypothetical protein